MEEPRLEEPGKSEKNGRPGVLVAAVALAREKPGEWVLARTYETPTSATTTGTRLRERFEDIETTARGGQLFVRVAN